MRTIRQTQLLAIVCAVAATPSWAVDGLLTADAYVNQAYPSNNFGATPAMLVSGTTRAFVQFDLSPLPAGVTTADIARASLILYANRVSAAGAVDVSTPVSGWTEPSVTFSSMPAAQTPAGSAVLGAGGQYVVFDVTAQVRNQINSPALNFGFEISPDAATPAVSVQFDTKESTATSHPARLDITLANAGPQGGPGPQGPPGAPGPQGVTGTAGPAGIALMDGKFGNNVDQARPAIGAPCTTGQIVLSAGGLAIGTPAQGQILAISAYSALYALLGTQYAGSPSDVVFALPDLRKVTPNGLTSTICMNGTYPH